MGSELSESRIDVPREFWREVPCGHPQDPVAALSADGTRAVCHCGCSLDRAQALSEQPPEAPGPIVPCSKCGCYVAVPERDERPL